MGVSRYIWTKANVPFAGGKVVGLLADKDRTTLVLVLDPSAKGGNMTIELPRHVMDSKGASNADTKYLMKIDGKGVDYKEVANNADARRINNVSRRINNQLTVNAINAADTKS